LLILPLAAFHALLLSAQTAIGLTNYATYGDGAEYVNLASSLLANPLSVVINLHPPLYPVAIRVFAVFSSYNSASLLLNAVAQTLTIIPIYESIGLYTNKSQRWTSTMLSVFPPSMIMYAGIGLSDTLAILFSSIFFYSLKKRRQPSMIISSLLAGMTHQITYLLVVPLVYFYATKDRRCIYRAFIPILPVILLSLYRYTLGQDILYYVNTHFVFARVYWGSRLFSWPFDSLLKAVRGQPIYAGGAVYAANQLTALGVVGLFGVYLVGAALWAKRRDAVSLSYGLPFIVFLAFYQVWFFIPRFLAYCFPLLISYDFLIGKKRIMGVLATALSCSSLAYALYFLLYALPASHWT
jgi:hypothetical protein